MNISDIFNPYTPIKTYEWKLGSTLSTSLQEKQVVILTCNEYRGIGIENNNIDFSSFRKELYELSYIEPKIKLYDLGDLVIGKTKEDTHYILKEVLLTLFNMQCKVIVLGGSVDLSYALFSAVHTYRSKVSYAHFSSSLDLDKHIQSEDINSNNFITKIFDNKDFNIKDFTLLAYQRHLANPSSLYYLKNIHFEAIKLSDIISKPENTEPTLRFTDLVTIDANSIETTNVPIAVHPQLNGLNSREICSCMQDIGLSRNLLAVGLFNFNFESSWQNTSLLAQMVWYLLEGISIGKTRPEKPNLETYAVMVDGESFIFKKDNFADQWYFGTSDNIENCIPCSYQDYLQAKKGIISKRLLKE